MENFECNSVQDLVFNASFRQWLRNGDADSDDGWSRWVAENIDKQELVRQAKAIIYALPDDFFALPDEEVTHEISAILQHCNSDPFEQPRTTEPQQKRSFIYSISTKWPAIAAVLILLSLASWFIYHRSLSSSPDRYRQFISADMNGLSEQSNHTGSVRLLRMTDGTSIYLENNSTLTWHTDFLGNREVYLDGEAFFEVTKSLSAPFVVYTRYMTTKVLGTSFRVTAWSRDHKASVAVTTGKVSVFRNDSIKKAGPLPKELTGIVVTPNQQVVYNDESNNFNKDLVNRPLPVEHPAENDFAFEATPVVQVFRRMHAVYGIDIIYDEQLLAQCSLTAVMGKESFYEKLNLICIAINATYEIIDGKIIINPKGCK